MIDLKIANKIAEIKKVKIFDGLKNEQLIEILENAQIIHLKKHQNLFSQEQKITNFYIILEGMIKLSKLNLKGSEAIINIVDNGSLCDIFSDNFTLSATAIKNTILLSFPIEIFKNLVKKNHDLLRNIFLEKTLQSHDLIDQIYNLKIDDNKVKIGKFLLKNFLKKGKKNNEIDLEFSKSEIASYLGMRLETFSRILHNIKEEESFCIKKNKIISCKENALCSYCDKEISVDCNVINSKFCQQKK